MIQHYLSLVRWKYLLPSTDFDTSPIYPLSTVDFILNILVPEASIRLIMQDKGWRGEQPPHSPAWESAWKDASQVRYSSVSFGIMRWRSNDEECRSILEEVRQGEGEMKQRIERMRGHVV